MQRIGPSVFSLAISGLLVGALTSPAFAYLDPGTGSIILQVLLGGVADAGATPAQLTLADLEKLGADALRANLDDLATRYDKDVMVAEHQYAWTLENGDSEPDFVWTPDLLTPGYPASPAGQLSMANDILSALAQVPGHHGAGFFYWEPEWIPGVGWQPGAGAPNDNLTLFDFGGAGRMAIFADPEGAVFRVWEPHEKKK